MASLATGWMVSGVEAVAPDKYSELCSVYNSQERPLPLLHMLKRKVLTLSPDELQTYVDGYFSKERAGIALESLNLLRFYEVGTSDRLKLVAFEKLLQWSIYVKNRSYQSLTRLDAREFYEFCIYPPKSWTSTFPSSRFSNSEEGKVPNPNWAPFLVIPESEKDKFTRAGRVIDWCTNIYDFLVVAGAAQTNIFSNLLK